MSHPVLLNLGRLLTPSNNGSPCKKYNGPEMVVLDRPSGVTIPAKLPDMGVKKSPQKWIRQPLLFCLLAVGDSPAIPLSPMEVCPV